MRRGARLALTSGALLLAGGFPALAEGVLEGRAVELRALVIAAKDAAPQISSHVIRMVSGPGIELKSMRAERAAAGDDPSGIVEISVDLGPDEILLNYAAVEPTFYADGYFSGYEFRFPDLPQWVIEGAELDPQLRLAGMEARHLQPVPGGLRLHVGGFQVDRMSRVRILFPAGPAPGV